jgi:hypothetical protein
LCFTIAVLAIIFSAASVALQVGANSVFMTALSAISTAVAAVVSVFVLLAARQSLVTSQRMLDEMRKQREAADKPIISVSSVPEPRRPGVLNLRVANTGKGPAYDLVIRFEPDIPWGESTINQAEILSGIPVLAGGDRIEFFLAAAQQLLDSDYPVESTADITYYRHPAAEERLPLTMSVRVLLGAWRGGIHRSA